MELVALTSAICFIAVGGFVGVRLLLLARQTRQLPEFTVGLGFFLVALVGYPLGLIALAPQAPVQWAPTAHALAHAATGVGSISIFVFTWRVFRPEERWASALAWTCMLGLVVCAVVAIGDSLTTTPGQRPIDSALVPRQLIVGLSYWWTAAEGLRWFGLLRKRLALGLAEPLVANRFLLWGVSGVFAGSAIAVSTWRMVVTGGSPNDAVAMLAIGVGGFTTSISIYLAFTPPRAYRAWIGSVRPEAG